MKQEEVKYYAINSGEIMVLQEFVGGLNLPWKQTNPYMQMLLNLKEREIKMQPGPVSSDSAPEMEKTE